MPVVPPSGAASKVRTAVPLEQLTALNAALAAVPAGFVVHKKLERGRERRGSMLAAPDERAVDWSAAEELAMASILADGIPIRFTGEDVERGTFSQRHAVLHDAVTGDRHVPLQALPQARAAFEIHNSALSELAVLGFELGYNLQEPARLVLWEAQYGDFINGAQTILDEYLLSGRAKWGMAPSLVLLLPHGYEGQGPDHSSARLERFLQSAADLNVRIVNCTTAAQYFHVLRRQALLLGTDPLPLVMLTPKSLLRHPMVASTPRELAEGAFQKVIDDEPAAQAATKVRRVVLCSGKVYVDLAGSEQRQASPHVALVRVEQIYPFPAEALKAVLDRYAVLREVCWVQEEPENMGAWEFVRPLLEQVIDGRWPLRYVGRVRNSSPSEGSAAWHQLNQRAVVAQAFEDSGRGEGAGSGAVETGLGAGGWGLGAGACDEHRCAGTGRIGRGSARRALAQERGRSGGGRRGAGRARDREDRPRGQRRSRRRADEHQARRRHRREGRRGAGAARSVEGRGGRAGRQPRTAGAPAAAPAGPKSTPTARNIAREHDVKLETVPAAGPRVTKQDVREFVAGSSVAAAPAAAPAPSARPAAPPPPAVVRTPGERTEERVRMTKRRATIARRLVEAQRTAAMLTTFNEVDMSAVMALRERRKEAFQKKHGVGLGIATFFVKAAVGALKAFPELNAEIQGDEIVYKRYVDIGVAVGAEGGLVVPVLRDADAMSFAEVERGIRDFAARAGNATLTLEDLKGGTFTITNGGVFGSLMSTPILNPPQVGILGLHKIADRAVPVNGQVVIRPMMYLALSYDHRLVDGREAVQFLVKVKDFIEDPAWLLLDG